MASGLEFKIVAGQNLAKLFARAGGRASAVIRKQIHSAQLRTQLGMREHIDTELNRRTGNLRRSIVIEPITGSGIEQTGRVGSAMIYARVQELGGTIRAKNVKNLTIPLGPVKTPKGVARGSARDIISNPGSFGYDGTFFHNKILFGRRNGKAEPLFKLKPSVTLPSRPFAQPAMEEESPRFQAGLQSAMAALFANP